MTCPDPTALARASSPNSDPEVAQHLKNCPSCWLDWQIQEGTRYALYPETEVPSALNERAIARIEGEGRRAEEVTRWWDLPVLGALVAIAAFAFFLAGGNAETPVPPAPAAAGAILAGIVAALYTGRRDLKARREALPTA